MELYVGIDNNGNDGGDVYWIIGTTVYDLDIDGSESHTDITDLDGAGNVGDTYLLAGTEEGQVFNSDDNGDSWGDAAKEPVTNSDGDGDIYVAVAGDYLDSGEAWASAGGNEGGVHFTRDYGDTWNGIGLLDTDMDTIIDIEPTPDWGNSGAVFVVADRSWLGDSDPLYPPPWNDEEGDHLWKYDGEYWERIFHRYLMDDDDEDTYIYDVEVSPEWESDDTVLFADRNNNRAYRSTDGGNKFKRCHKQPVEPNGFSSQALSWLVIDDSSRVVGFGDGDIYRTTNNGTTWSRKKEGDYAIYSFALDPNNPDNILAGDSNGEVWLSEDGGSDWDDKGEPDEGSGNIPFCAFDADYASNGYFYAAIFDESSPSVWRYSSWDDIDGISGTWVEDVGGTPSAEVRAGNGIVAGSNGILYVLDWTDTGASFENAAARSINPATGGTSGDDGVYFEFIDSGWEDDAIGWGLWLTEGESNTLWTITGIWDDDDNRYEFDEIWTYTDNIYEGPVLNSPANNTSSLRVDEVTLRWEDMGSKADEYYIFVSEDVGFAYYDVFTSTIPWIRLGNLEDGRSYYWKVAIMEGEDALSMWSNTWKFTTQLSEAQWNPFVGGIPEAPYNGATDVPLMPSFAWNAADWATGYEFELADNPGFSPTIQSFRGAGALDTTVYLLDAALEYCTTYYWRVRAVTSTTQSEWANGVFTTVGAPPPAPSPPPPAPTPPAPIVPAPPIPTYLLWTIIGVGAVLVIAVIILIVRTRARI
jgi:hypothetical protein